MGYKNRDVEVVFLKEGLCLVAACDSCGAIGSKELDAVSVPADVTGRFTARVALLEVIASGAIPQMITVAISNEPDPTGIQILSGVRAELLSAGLKRLKMVTSTEKNIPTKQTGLGISVFGSCDFDDLRLGKTEPGDFIYGLGKPKVGPEVDDPEDREIIQVKHLAVLLKKKPIHDLIPVGSRGIRYECELLQQTVRGRVEFAPGCPVPITKSAGPSTVLLFSAKDKIQELGPDMPPLYLIGQIFSL
ncbi:MAG: alpha-ribazole kinase [Peptococcaceae bacterium]|nr:alpha-ribazole kinase [Peptococcaceae bacterium]